MLQEIAAHKQSLQDEVIAKLKDGLGQEKADEIKTADLELFSKIQTEFEAAAYNQINDNFMKKLAKENGPEELVNMIKEQLRNSEEFKRILSMPENCACSEISDFSSKKAGGIMENVNRNLAAAMGDMENTLSNEQKLDILGKGYIIEMQNQFEADKKMRSSIQMMLDKEIENPEERHELRAADFKNVQNMSLTDRDLFGEEFRRYAESLENVKECSEILEAAENVKGCFDGSKENSAAALYMYTKELSEKSQAFLQKAEDRQLELSDDVRHAAEQLRDLSQVFSEYEKRDIRNKLATDDYVGKNRFSAEMHDYFREVSKALLEKKQAFEHNDPMWLPSNRYIRGFKSMLNDAAELAERLSQCTSATAEERQELQTALSELHNYAQTAGDNVHPSSTRGQRRLNVIINTWTLCTEKINTYTGNGLAAENRGFAEASEKLKQKNAKLEEAGKHVKERNSNLGTLEKYLNFRNKISFGAKTPEPVRKLFERAAVAGARLDALPLMLENHEPAVLTGQIKDEYLTYAAEVMVANAIAADRAANPNGPHDLEKQYTDDPKKVIETVKGYAETSFFVNHMDKPEMAGKYIARNNKAINNKLLGKETEAEKKKNEVKKQIDQHKVEDRYGLFA